MEVKLLDLQAQYKPIKEEVMNEINKVMDSCYFINGPKVSELENLIAEYSTCSCGIGMSSGTDALVCALMGLDIQEGDEIITTPFTFFATAGSIWRLGAKPVFVDIDPITYNIDVTKIESAITAKTKAIIPVHLFGQMSDMDEIMLIAEKHNLKVIEDSAQSIGSSYKGKKSGSIGDIGCFSFFPSKNLGTTGDGGMCVTQDKDLGEKLKILRNHGSKPKYFHKMVGGNFRLDTMHAAVLTVKLKYLDKWSNERRENASVYDSLLKGVKEIQTPVIKEGNVSVYNQYVIRVEKRDELKQYLLDNKIGTEIYYPLSLHEQDCFKDLGYKTGDFPESEKAAANTLALPIYSELEKEQLEYVVKTIKNFYK